MLNREDILKVKDCKTERIKVPEWSGDVYVKQMTVGEHNRFTEYAKGERIESTKLLVLGVCDEHGNQLFTESDIRCYPNSKLKML